MKDNNDLLSGDNLLNQITNISKAHAYDILVGQVKELKAENEKLIKDKAELLELVIETKGKWFFDHVADDGLLDKLRAAITKHSS